jgi:hypothetical protein
VNDDELSWRRSCWWVATTAILFFVAAILTGVILGLAALAAVAWLVGWL